MTARQPQYDLTDLLTRAGAELVGRNRAIMPGANHSGPQSGQWNRFGSVVMSYMRFHRQLLAIRYQLTREGSPMTKLRQDERRPQHYCSGCGELLPPRRKGFFHPDCLKADKRERMREKRRCEGEKLMTWLRRLRCPECGARLGGKPKSTRQHLEEGLR